MSPTALRVKGYRFFFFSLEEARMHVHVSSAEGDAKFWLEPDIDLAMSKNLGNHQLREIREIIEEHKNELTSRWRQHFHS